TGTGNVLSVDVVAMTATSIHDVDDDFVQAVHSRGGAIAYRHYADDDLTTVHSNGNYYDINSLWGGTAYFTAVHGSKVAFVGAYGGPWNVFAGDYVDGSFTQITDNEELGTGYYEIDTDGEWVVYRRFANGSNAIVAYNLVTAASVEVGSGHSPHVGAGHVSYVAAGDDVVVYDLAAETASNLTEDIAGEASEATIDGDILAFTADSALYVYDFGTGQRSLVQGATTNRARAVGNTVLFVTADHHMARVYNVATGGIATVANDASTYFDFRPAD
ncbi:MAG TPA: hypothetical protein VLC93_20090, partial [Myxococcota bacterium]|nr:hypothetical protein [Myxococcota bacterium]